MPCENKHSFLQLSPSPKICQNSVVQNPSSCCQSITSVRVGLGSGLTADERDARPYRFTLFLILSILLILSKTTTTPAYQSINPTIKQFLHALHVLHGYCHLSFRRARRARPTFSILVTFFSVRRGIRLRRRRQVARRAQRGALRSKVARGRATAPLQFTICRLQANFLILSILLILSKTSTRSTRSTRLLSSRVLRG